MLEGTAAGRLGGVVAGQRAKCEQDQARLGETEPEQDASGLITGMGAQDALGARRQHIEQHAIVVLAETAQRATHQTVPVELPSEPPKRAAGPAMENRLRDTERTAEAGDNAADGRDLDMRRGVTHQIDVGVSHPPFCRYPPGVAGNAGRLKPERLEVMALEKALETAPGIWAVFADQPQRAVRGRLRNQPVEVGRLVRMKPDPRRVVW